ncbi:hypothetical protein B0A48_13468 [Cryoendolithus antarcticus]|uniref:Uncharacterized protein n=1 Tax=Cryoendolithus antarcticus TaxID=1507870 RepID=A0A1V8SP74_9PEZI|nr:hypothetical protein B0A48_13468 [Cryoendolithus antarcticus]
MENFKVWFAEGDEISRWALAHELTFHTSSARDASVSALRELFQRVAQAAPIQRGPRAKSSRKTLYTQQHNPSVEVGPAGRGSRIKPSRLALYAQDSNPSIEHAARHTAADEDGGCPVGMQSEISRRTSAHQAQPMTPRRKASPPSPENISFSRREILTSRLQPSKQKSQTSLLIEYFEAGKIGDRGKTKPSVRVKLKPKGVHEKDVQITGIGKDRQPSYRKRIFLEDRTADYAMAKDPDRSHLRKDHLLNLPIPDLLRTVNKASDTNMMPQPAYAESAAESTLSVAKARALPSPDLPLAERNIGSHEVHGGNDTDDGVETADATRQAEPCLATLSLESRKVRRKRKVPFSPHIEVGTGQRQEQPLPLGSRQNTELDEDRTFTEPEHSMLTSNARGRSTSQDRIGQNVMEKLAQSPGKTRKSSTIRRNGEHRRRSSKSHDLDKGAVGGADSGSLRSGTIAYVPGLSVSSSPSRAMAHTPHLRRRLGTQSIAEEREEWRELERAQEESDEDEPLIFQQDNLED